ncbi:MAG TPA: cupin domain-containing protein, partial [Parafilimonas sp.]
MKAIQQYIDSGILQAYVFGIATPEEEREIEEMASQHGEVREAIEAFEYDFEKYAIENAVTPDPTIKPLLIAAIDYTERIKKGETPSYPGTLQKSSQIEDYKEWLERTDMQLPDDFKDIYAKIIRYTPEALTAVVWIKDAAPWEMHDHEFEKFLVVEGTCDIIIENETHHLKAGDYLSIPLHKKHTVKVTSDIP